MRVLLDTHVFLWMISSPEKLSQTAINILESEENNIFLSSVSGLEIAIKYQIDKLKLPDKPDIYLPQQIRENLIEVLPIYMNHTKTLLTDYSYPKANWKIYPFSRMIPKSSNTR